MPEGPSIVILREAASIYKGKKILEVSGNAKLDLQRLHHKKVIDIRSWGKHFLLCCEGVTVRIHLMMFGSYRINEEKDAAPRLSLRFANGELNFYTCSVQFIEGDIDEAYDWEVDIMSDQWNAKKALASLREHGDTMACDALLDQHIFSGSGNIIKNEVLYRIRVHPETRVGKLPKAKLHELVKETRSYSFDFYKWKKAYELKKHWLAYGQKICGRCHIPFIVTYMGKGKRKTYYCDNCQALYE